MRVFSLANDKSQSRRNRQTHPPLRSTPAEHESAHTGCKPLKRLAPNGAGNVQGQQKKRAKGWALPMRQGHHLSSSVCSQNRHFYFIQCHKKRLALILPFLKCNSLMSFLPSQYFWPHGCRCQGGCKEQGDGEEGGHAHPSDTSSVSL